MTFNKDEPKAHPLWSEKFRQIRCPQPSAWSVARLTAWLKKNIIILKAHDISFMTEVVKSYGDLINRETKAANLKPESTSWDRSGWEGILPNVRLIETILLDELRTDFVHRNAGESRTDVDARNSEHQTPSFFEKVRIKFNDRMYKVTSCPLNAMWGDSYDCNWEQLDCLKIDPIPDEKTCKLRFMKLNNALGTVYQRWKTSGNGEDQVNLEEMDESQINLDPPRYR
jgi:hypothetical protein